MLFYEVVYGQTLPLATATDWLSQKLQIPFGFVMKLKLFVIGYNSPRAKVMDLNNNLEYIFDKTMKIRNYFQGFGIFIEKLEKHDFFNKMQIYLLRAKVYLFNGG